MNAVETWNHFAQSALSWAGGAAATSGVALIAASMIWRVIRRRASAHLGYLLFSIPLLPLVLPTLGTLELPGELNPRAAQPPQAEPYAVSASPATLDAEAPVLEYEDHSTEFGAGVTAGAGGAAVRPTWQAWTVLLWALGAASLALRFLVAQARTDGALRAAPELGGAEGERVRAALRRLRPRMRVHRKLRVVTSDSVSTPAVWGVRRPVLVLAPGLASRLDDRQLDWVLLHELAHVARRDLLVGSAQRLVQILWFFDPLVWLAGRAADELREAACDEAALSFTPTAYRRRCAEALVEVAAGRPAPPAPRIAVLQALQEDKKQMKKRILRMLDPHRVATRRSSPAGLTLLFAFASSSLVSVTFAQDPDDPLVELVQEEAIEEVSPVEVEEARRAVDRSLAWLLTQQAPDGHWPTGPGTEQDSGEFNSIGVTALVMLSLLEAQADDADPARAAALERGRAFLASVQIESGLFGEPKGYRFMQSHAVATRAWLETRAGHAEAEWRPPAERAVAAILRARNPYKGWRFDELPNGDNDTFTTGLMLAALAEARAAGLEVPARDTEEALSYIDAMTDKPLGRTGYDSPGSNDPRLASKGEDFPADSSEMCTAMAIVTRLAWGERADKSTVIRKGAYRVSEAAPDWDAGRGSIDYYYWLFGTRALRELGGFPFEHWRADLFEALIPNQRADASGGWWPAVDAWSTEGTSVHATAICTLALQAAL